MSEDYDSFWKLIKLNCKRKYMAVRGFFLDQMYDFNMTDYERLWSEKISLKDMCSRLELENEGMEVAESEIMDVIDATLTLETTKYYLEVSKDKTTAKLQMVSEPYGSKLSFVFNCDIESPEQMAELVVRPAMRSLSYLLHERSALFETIKDKDLVLDKVTKKTKDSSKRRFSHFDQNMFEETMLMDFEHAREGDWYLNVYSKPCQTFLRRFDRINPQPEGEVVQPGPSDEYDIDDEGCDEKDLSNYKKNPDRKVLPRTEKEEEEVRRTDLEKKLAEELKKANKRKKMVRF